MHAHDSRQSSAEGRSFLVRDDTRDLRRVDRPANQEDPGARQDGRIVPERGREPLTRLPNVLGGGVPTSPGRRPAEDGIDDEAGTGARAVVAPVQRLVSEPHRDRRLLALARAIASELDSEGRDEVIGFDTARENVQAVLSRLASYRGVRFATLLTRRGRELESVAHNGNDTYRFGKMMASLRAVADLALRAVDGGETTHLTACADGFRVELVVVDERYLLVLVIDEALEAERLQPILHVALSSLNAALQSR